jgi:hypothetical protein
MFLNKLVRAVLSKSTKFRPDKLEVILNHINKSLMDVESEAQTEMCQRHILYWFVKILEIL